MLGVTLRWNSIPSKERVQVLLVTSCYRNQRYAPAWWATWLLCRLTRPSRFEQLLPRVNTVTLCYFRLREIQVKTKTLKSTIFKRYGCVKANNITASLACFFLPFIKLIDNIPFLKKCYRDNNIIRTATDFKTVQLCYRLLFASIGA